MATSSLGRLTLDLAVKLSDFTDGMSRAERETKAKTDAMNKSVNDFKENLIDGLSGTRVGSAFSSINSNLKSVGGVAGMAGLAVAGVGLAAVGSAIGLSKLTIETAKADAEMAVLANRASVGVEKFQILSKASEGLKVSQEQLGSILADVQEKLGEFSATEGGGAKDFFEALQNNTSLTTDEIRDLGKTLQGKDGVEAIQLMKNKLDELGATSQEQRFVFESFASDLGNLMPLFENGGVLLERYGKELREAGVIKTAEAIEQSKVLAAQTKALHTRYDGLKQQLASKMMPVLNNLIGYFVDGSKKGNQFGGVVKSIGVVAKATASIIVGLATGISALVGTFTAVYDQFYNLGRTGRAFLEADGIQAKLQALSDGMGRAQVQAATSVNSIVSSVQSGFSALNGFWGETSTQMDGLSSAMYELQDTSIAAGDGLSYSTKQADEMAKAADKAAKSTKKQTKELSRMEQVYSAFVKAGLSDNQARIITAEVGREGSFQDRNLFGYHKDPHNGAVNAGMISWQGSRGKQLIKYLTDLGLVKNGKIMPTQEALDAQAMFVVKEITSNSRYSKTKNDFLANPDVSYQQGNKALGKNYIRWRYDDPKYQSGHRNRDRYYKQLNAKLGNKGLTNDLAKQLKEEKKQAEQLAKQQLAIATRYMNEREKAEAEHQQALQEIDNTYGKDTAEAEKYRAEEVARYQEEQRERVQSVMAKYQSKEERLVYEYEKAKQDIKNKFAEDSPQYTIAMDALDVYHREEMQKIRQQDAKKYLQQERYVESVKKLIQDGKNAISSNVGDIIARSTMSSEDYQRYSLGSQQDQAIMGANSTYSQREAEINKQDDSGNYEIASAGARYELLQEAKREHEAAMYAIELEYGEKRKELEKEITDNKIAMYQSTTASMLGLLQGFFGESKTLQRMAWAAEKGFTLARILIKEKEALMNAWSSAPFPYNLGAVATTAMKTGVLTAAASAITPKGFKTGGYTGSIGANNVAGVVHGNEYVFDAPATKAIGVDNLEKIRQGKGFGEPTVNVYIDGVKTQQTVDSNGNIRIQMRDEADKAVKRSWNNLYNPNSPESRAVKDNIKAPRNRA